MIIEGSELMSPSESFICPSGSVHVPIRYRLRTYKLLVNLTISFSARGSVQRHVNNRKYVYIYCKNR